MFKFSQLVSKQFYLKDLLKLKKKSNEKLLQMTTIVTNKSRKSYNKKSNRKIKKDKEIIVPMAAQMNTESQNPTTGKLPTKMDDKEIRLNYRSWNYTKLGQKFNETDFSGLQFTVMSYNILAQELLELHPYLYENHNQDNLNWGKRLACLIKEITTINPQILCLQEVQENHLPAILNGLMALNFDYVFKKKTGIRNDGCAIFYKKNIFLLAERHPVEYYQPNTERLDRENVALIAKLCLRKNPKTCFIVSTTHLLYNPRRQDVRLAQIQVLLAELDRVSITGFFENKQPKRIPIILTGDFNLQPYTAPYELLTKGDLHYFNLTRHTLDDTIDEPSRLNGKEILPPHLGITDNCQHIDIIAKQYTGSSRLHNSEFNLNNSNINDGPTNGENIENDDLLKNHSHLFSSGRLTHNLNLTSVYRHKTIDGQFEASTFQNKWVTVDYIFYSKYFSPRINSICEGYLKLLAHYTLPTADQCHQMGKIPNFESGSDHLPLAAKFLIQISK